MTDTMDMVVVPNPQERKHTSFKIYKPKKRGLESFRKAKVGSCSGVVVQQGARVALPIYLKTECRDNSRGYNSAMSTSQDTYKTKHSICAYSQQKPLVRYDVNHERNRLPVIFKPRTISNISFDERSARHNQVRSVEHSYIGNFQGFDESSNHEINMIQRRHHKSKFELLN